MRGVWRAGRPKNSGVEQRRHRAGGRRNGLTSRSSVGSATQPRSPGGLREPPTPLKASPAAPRAVSPRPEIGWGDAGQDGDGNPVEIRSQALEFMSFADARCRPSA